MEQPQGKGVVKALCSLESDALCEASSGPMSVNQDTLQIILQDPEKAQTKDPSMTPAKLEDNLDGPTRKLRRHPRRPNKKTSKTS